MSAAVAVPVVVVAIIVVRMVALLRGRRLREKYVWSWFALALVIVIALATPGLLTYLTAALGFQLPSNMILASAVVLLLLIALNHSIELSRLDDERRRLVEEAALAELELRRLDHRLADLEGGLPRPPAVQGNPPNESEPGPDAGGASAG